MSAAFDDTAPRDNRASRHLSLSNEHATPIEVIEAARTLLGAITLDPATCALAQTRVRAVSWFGLDQPNRLYQDGLSLHWYACGEPSRVFLNPPGGKIQNPYGTSSAKVWWFRLAEEYARGRVHSAVFLGFSLELLQTTQVKIPHIDLNPTSGPVPLAIPLQAPICVPDRRLRFDKMVPRCTLCDRFIDPDRAKIMKGKDPKLCSPDVYLPPEIQTRLRERGIAMPTSDRCPRNGVEHWGPLDFCAGDSPTHSNVLVYLPPLGTTEEAARVDFQRAFAKIGRVR
jgi:hypothetical protein